MNKIEQYFHGETAVHILLEEDAGSASRSTGSGANHQKRLGPFEMSTWDLSKGVREPEV